jgi:hypothetical protein
VIVLLVVSVFLIGLEPYIGIFAAMGLYLLSGFVMIPFRSRVINYIEGGSIVKIQPKTNIDGEL